jgi:hypothetical protein
MRGPDDVGSAIEQVPGKKAPSRGDTEPPNAADDPPQHWPKPHLTASPMCLTLAKKGRIVEVRHENYPNENDLFAWGL